MVRNKRRFLDILCEAK